MNWYLKVLKNYANFSGRASRKEYWMFQLINIIIIIALWILTYLANSAFMVLYVLYVLGIVIPSIAVSVRRLHDIDKSGFWYFIHYVPLIGPIWLLVLLCTEGNMGPNTYGSDPEDEAL